MTDYYQYCLVSLIWLITAPLILYLMLSFFNDVSRYLCIPFVITGLVFLGFAILISAIAILNTLLNGNGWLIRSAQMAQVSVYLLC
jgi:hypothetical protein